MPIRYPSFTPHEMRFVYCPLCRGSLVDGSDLDGHLRPQCSACGWVYYPTNLLGAVVVINTPRGVVFLLPPDGPAEAPAALPAGIVEFGESPEQAAVREAREETGLHIKVTRELGKLFWQSPLGPMLSFLFEARAVSGTLLESGPEGHVALFQMGHFPLISPDRKASQRALEIYLEHHR